MDRFWRYSLSEMTRIDDIMRAESPLGGIDALTEIAEPALFTLSYEPLFCHLPEM